MILEETYTLSNGVNIPKLGLGTWLIPDKDASRAVKEAIAIGYRHIDTAQAYMNEAGVGKGIQESGINRQEIFVTTKLAAEIKTYQNAVTSIDESLNKLGLDYIDLMIIHSPKPWKDFLQNNHYFEENKEAWRALEEAYQAGKLRAIGLSNFKQIDIENILGSCSVKPMVNQILAHISNTPSSLIQYSQEQGMLVEAYSPLGHGALFKNQKIISIAEKYKVSVSQICIRYTLQLGLVSLPKTANPEHMRTNSNLDFSISEEDMDLLTQIEPIKDYGDACIFPVFARN